MNDNSANPPAPGPAKGLLRQYGTYMIGGAVVVGLIAAPLEIAIKNNRAEYEATGDFGALFGHPFDSAAHSAFKAPGYAALIAQHPDWRLSPDDAPEIRAKKISLINTDTLNKLDAERQAATAVQTAKITGGEQAKADIIKGVALKRTLEENNRIYNDARAALTLKMADNSFELVRPVECQKMPEGLGLLDLLAGGLVLPQLYDGSADPNAGNVPDIKNADGIIKTALDTEKNKLQYCDLDSIRPLIYGNHDTRFSGKSAWTTNSNHQKVVPVESNDKGYWVVSADYIKIPGVPLLAPAYSPKPGQ